MFEYEFKKSFLSQVFIYVIKLSVHVSCSNVQDPKPPQGDEMEVESTQLPEETT